MKRKIAVLMLCITFAFGLTACSNKTETPKADDKQTTVEEDKTTTEDNTAAEDEVVKDGTAEDNMLVEDNTDKTTQEDAATEQTMTGTLEENKGVMFTLISDEDKEAYVFPLTDDNKVLLDGISKGDKLTVTFSGGVPTPDNLGTVVTNVELAQ